MRHFVPHSRLSGLFPLACRLTESSTMSLSLPDRWVWDFWFAHDGDEDDSLTFLLASLGLVGMMHTFRNLSALVLRPARAESVFTGDFADEANRHLGREYRKGFEVPDKV